MQPAVGQGTLDKAVDAHPPVPFPAARGQMDDLGQDAQGEQMAAAHPGPFPLLPVVHNSIQRTALRTAADAER